MADHYCRNVPDPIEYMFTHEVTIIRTYGLLATTKPNPKPSIEVDLLVVSSLFSFTITSRYKRNAPSVSQDKTVCFSFCIDWMNIVFYLSDASPHCNLEWEPPPPK